MLKIVKTKNNSPPSEIHLGPSSPGALSVTPYGHQWFVGSWQSQKAPSALHQ